MSRQSFFRHVVAMCIFAVMTTPAQAQTYILTNRYVSQRSGADLSALSTNSVASLLAPEGRWSDPFLAFRSAVDPAAEGGAVRIGTPALIVTSPLWSTTAGLALEKRPSSPSDYALSFFHNLPAGGIETALRAVRTEPLPEAERERIRRTLPKTGELTPTSSEITKLDAVQAVLLYHQRHRTFDIKVIDIPQALVGLHARTVVLISRPALTLLSAAELQAVIGHEVGHDYFWGEFELAQRRADRRARQQVELQCDGVAVLTLVALGVDTMGLTRAVEKMVRFNNRLEVRSNARDYPTLRERERFVAALLQSRQF
jgi:hypothetical protein